MFAGFSEALFWRLTPRQVIRHFDAAGRRDRRDMDMLMAAAWYGAAFERSKRMPKLGEVVSPPERPRRQSPEETQEVMRGIFASRRGRARSQ